MISAEAGRAIDLWGEPKYFRAVRLTNAQWAKSVQEILKLSMPSGLEANFQAPPPRLRTSGGVKPGQSCCSN